MIWIFIRYLMQRIETWTLTHFAIDSLCIAPIYISLKLLSAERVDDLLKQALGWLDRQHILSLHTLDRQILPRRHP